MYIKNKLINRETYELNREKNGGRWLGLKISLNYFLYECLYFLVEVLFISMYKYYINKTIPNYLKKVKRN